MTDETSDPEIDRSQVEAAVDTIRPFLKFRSTLPKDEQAAATVAAIAILLLGQSKEAASHVLAAAGEAHEHVFGDVRALLKKAQTQ